jgi:cell wall integrity and stress response component
LQTNFCLQASTTDATTTGSVVRETNAGGQIKTITVPAASSTAGLDSSAKTANEGSSRLSGGSIAGIVIGVIGGIALVGALIFMVFFYRKRARSASPIPSQDMADNRTSQGSSFVRGVFPQGHAQEMSGSSSLGRKQTFMDNRLKTDIYPNGPRDSSVSLQDNEDYSRPVLRVSAEYFD